MKYICNPMNLPYKYQFVRMDGRVRAFREAADPSLILFKGRYYMFPSMTAGFFTSDDLADWEFHPYLQDMVFTDYAPDVCVVGDSIWLNSSSSDRKCPFYRSKDPVSEPFEEFPGFAVYWDPCTFLDDDGRVYLYFGCSNEKPIYGVEMNPETMSPLGSPVPLIHADPDHLGWERRAEDNVSGEDPRPWVEGSWMTKFNGRYYLQYAAPGTEFNIYCDSVYVSNAPLGPFTPAENNPFSLKPGGFISAAGHGSAIQLADGSWRHVSTMRISLAHMFERRVGIWPMGFDADGEMYCDQRFGDWPMPVSAQPWSDPEWMLLSYNKPARATGGTHPERAVNEEIRDWWQASDSRDALEIDLEQVCDVRAIQINFADSDLFMDMDFPEERRVDTEPRVTRWRMEGSTDGEGWFTIADKTQVNTNLPHDLIVREDGFACRYIRVTDFELPFGQPAKVSGLRVFGHAKGEKPAVPTGSAVRADDMDMLVKWHAENADGVCVLWGHAPDKLYHSCLVHGGTEKHIGALAYGQSVYLRIDAFNACGITRGEPFVLED